MQSNDGVLYMLTGTKHAVNLAVAVHALREGRHWDGPVCIAAGCAESHEVAAKIAADRRSGEVTVKRWDAPTKRSMGRGGSGVQYANKCEMHRLSPFDRTIFMDADTVVVGDISGLLSYDEQVRLTRFANWASNQPPVRKRVEGWRQFAPKEVATMLAAGYPAINTGVIGFTSAAGRWFDAWREMTHRNLSFICDEIAAQLIFPWYPHMIMPETYNTSPIYSWSRQGPLAEGADPRIWHFHGKKQVKHPHGRYLWLPRYKAAIADGFAELPKWTPGSDKRLRAYLDDPTCYGDDWMPSGKPNTTETTSAEQHSS